MNDPEPVERASLDVSPDPEYVAAAAAPGPAIPRAASERHRWTPQQWAMRKRRARKAAESRRKNR